uniref:HrEpiC protein n=1 Tax=Halocynthia roretzi TaxID=7729 RepID=Q9Y1V4_HALRO|nr:HrEpiC [Halocynthia roretzi]
MKFLVCLLVLIVGASAKSVNPAAPTKRQLMSSLLPRPQIPTGYPTSRWGQWGPYGPCSASCGVGTRMKNRICHSAVPNTNLPRPTRTGTDPSLLLLLSSLGGNSNSSDLSSILPFLIGGGSAGGSSIDPSLLLLLSGLGNNNNSSSSGGLGNLGSLLPLLLSGGSGGMSNDLLLFTLLPQLTGSSSGSSNMLSSLLPLLLTSGGGAGAGGLSSILPLLLLSGNSNGTGSMDLSTILLLQMLQQPKTPVYPIVPPMPISPSCVGRKYETATCSAPACVIATRQPTYPPTMRPTPQQPQYTQWGIWGNCQMQNNKCVKTRTRNCLSSMCEATKQITYCQDNQCMPVTPMNTCNPYGTRVECGHPGITRQDCIRRGCCFDSSQSNTNWCYQNSQSYLRLKSGAQNSDEKAEPKPTPEYTEEKKSE